MEYETAPGPAVSEIPPYLLPAGQWALLKRAGDIKSSITPGTVGRRANEWMSHGGWAALWSLNVVGGSAAAVKSGVVKSPRPSCSLSLLGLEVFVLEGCRKNYCLFFSVIWESNVSSSETGKMRTPLSKVTDTQHGTFRDMNSDLQSFLPLWVLYDSVILLVSLIAGPQLLSLHQHQGLSLFCKQMISPQPAALCSLAQPSRDSPSS